MHPKKIIPYLLLILLFSSCTTNKQNKNHPTTSENKTIIQADTTVNHVEEKLVFSSIDPTYINENFKFKGDLKESINWNDKEGEHIVFTCEIGVYHTDENEEEGYKQNAEIFCYHYLKKNNQFSQVWKIYDFSKDCPFDALAKFCEKSLEVTDLDKDEVPEIWLIYRIACRSDVSPSELKLIMYEGSKKYKLHGSSMIELSKNEKYGGEINNILNFNDHQLFLDYAKKKWTKNVKENFQ